MFVLTSARPAQIPKANASNTNAQATPADYTLATTEYTVPIAVNLVGDVTLFIKTTSVSYAGASYTVQARSDRAHDWVQIANANLTTNGTIQVKVASGNGTQIRVLNTAVDTMEIWANGVPQDAS